jgi:response regulator RpfG family c-di-GMP phosphodiesterase
MAQPIEGHIQAPSSSGNNGAAEALRDEAGHQLDPEIVDVLLHVIEDGRRRNIRAA